MESMEAGQEQQEKRINQLLQKELNGYRPKQIEAVLELLSEGNTVPFIARYRKERTGSLDEVAIREIEERHAYLVQLELRKEEVLRLISEQDKLTPELEKVITAADKMQRVEDLYRPYRQKKRTKAALARERGLDPLAQWILTFPEKGSLAGKAQEFVNGEEARASSEEVLAGAHEILAEIVSDEPAYRQLAREYTQRNGLIRSTAKQKEEDEKGVYTMYYDFSQPVKAVAPHRILAMNRGEKEGVLKVTIEAAEEAILTKICRNLIPAKATVVREFAQNAVQDSYQRFIRPAIEREIRNELTAAAEEQAIRVFGENLHNLLLQPPLKGKVVLGLDPAYRTGCKLAVVDPTGKVLAKAVIYPHPPAGAAKREAAGPEFRQIVEKYGVEMVAIGNGTASRESERFVAGQLQKMTRPVYYAIVNEAGASVYSASEVAREEFPDFQVEERSAVSIARRLQDPLAELVKIDPEAIGVGQYQHDVSQKKLTEQLDFVVETAVNQVGVNLNTASSPLLQHISGLNKTIANNIVAYREETGAFTKRSQLKKVPRLGPKAFEQSAGFLRIVEGPDILDNTDIHPESYDLAREIIRLAGVGKSALGSEEAKTALSALDLEEVKRRTGAGKETLLDILKSLTKPGRDLREELTQPLLRQDVLEMEDLKPGMELEGTVRNVVDFGAFVDIGVKQDGLVHISRLSRGFVKHPSDVVSVGEIVTVWVDSIDTKRGRIGLTMLPPQEQ